MIVMDKAFVLADWRSKRDHARKGAQEGDITFSL
jgi:hypothetical protein